MRRLLLLTAFLLLAACAPAARAATCVDPVDGAPPVLGSTDGDDIADLAVGRPAQARVTVRQSRAGTVKLTGGASFGRAVAIGDVDGDSCADVVVGEPAADRVLVYRGSPAGLQTTPLTIPGAAGSAFGTALAIAQDTGLWIGEPGANAVQRYTLDAAGVAAPQGPATTAAAPTPGERFGSVLAPGVQGVYVGVPKRAKGRGGVERIRAGQANQVFALPHAGKGDAFGASLATNPFGSVAYAGAPGRAHDRGVVQVLGGKRYSQDTKGVPGKARKGHRFGSAVAAGRALTCQEDFGSFAVGASGERSVTLIGSKEEHCPKRLTYASKTRAGTSLGIVRYRDDFDEDIRDTLVVGETGRDRVLVKPQPRLAVPGTGRIVIASAESGSTLQ